MVESWHGISYVNTTAEYHEMETVNYGNYLVPGIAIVPGSCTSTSRAICAGKFNRVEILYLVQVEQLVQVNLTG